MHEFADDTQSQRKRKLHIIKQPTRWCDKSASITLNPQLPNDTQQNVTLRNLVYVCDVGQRLLASGFCLFSCNIPFL